jgi:hypothetical protein
MAKITEIVAALLTVREEYGNLEVAVIENREFKPPRLEGAFVELCDVATSENGTTRVVLIKPYA